MLVLTVGVKQSVGLPSTRMAYSESVGSAWHRRGFCRQKEAMGVSGSSFMVNSHGHCKNR